MPPPPTNQLLVLGALVFGVLGGCVATWSWVASRVLTGRAVLPAAEVRLVPWRAGSVLFVGVLCLSVQVVVVAGYLAVRDGRTPRVFAQPAASAKVDPVTVAAVGPAPKLSPKEQLGLVSVVNVGLLVLVPLVLSVTSGATVREFGLSRDRLRRGVLTGVVTFFAVTPLVHGVFAISRLVFKPNLHELQKMLSKGMAPGVIALAFVSAVVVAPLFEELLFRAVLQGWLARVFARKDSERADEMTAFGEVYEPQRRSWLDPWRRFLPIGLTSLLFGAMHFEQMPAPIPLFVLSVALGTIYQRTGSLAAPIVLHGLFNGLSTLTAVLTLPKAA